MPLDAGFFSPVISVNFGCGRTFHRDWINLDSVPLAPEVRPCDVRERLPFSDESVEVIYHSHLLEHLNAATARQFLRECRRVLRPGGIIRVVVPDLEGIARAYLTALESAASGGDALLHEWTQMELTDQIARTFSGGEMVPFLRRLNAEALTPIRARWGKELDGILYVDSTSKAPASRITLARIGRKLKKEILGGFAWLIGGRDLRGAVGEAIFRQSGEVHRVMYDRISLGALLRECGFVDPKPMAADDSGIAKFNEYALDVLDGAVRKPDSLFMEAMRR